MEEGKQSLFKKIFGSEGGKKKVKSAIVIVLAVIVAVIFLSSFLPKKESEKNQTSFDDLSSSFKSLEYCDALENRLERVLVNVKDIGRVNVFVMVESSPTFKYLEEVQEESGDAGNSVTSKKTTVYEARNGTITSPVVELEILPKIVGVLIVATGAKDTKMKVTLTNIAATILSVDISKVEVLEGR